MYSFLGWNLMARWLFLIYELVFYKLRCGILGNRIQKVCYKDLLGVLKTPL